jgi:DNA invertase Pin-like site-specific DNA recombinase
MRVAIYVRCSTTDQDTEAQEKMCRKYCEAYSHDVYAVYCDDGVSGAKDSRPAFNAMQRDMRLMKFNCVCVTKLDRIGRSVKHILSLFDEFQGKGVHFVATTQNIDTSGAAGTLQLHIMAAFAEFERNIIAERTREGLKYAVNVGKRGKDKQPRKKRGVFRKPIIVLTK